MPHGAEDPDRIGIEVGLYPQIPARILEDAGLVQRTDSEFDKRVTFVRLTDRGVLAMGKYLEQS